MGTIFKYKKGRPLLWIAAVSGVAKDVAIDSPDVTFSAVRGEPWYWVNPRVGAMFRAAERELYTSAPREWVHR